MVSAAPLAMNMARSESNEFPVELSSTRTAAARAKEINEITSTIHNTVIRTIPLVRAVCIRIVVHQGNSQYITGEIDSHGNGIVFRRFRKPAICSVVHAREVLETVHGDRFKCLLQRWSALIRRVLGKRRFRI